MHSGGAVSVSAGKNQESKLTTPGAAISIKRALRRILWLGQPR